MSLDIIAITCPVCTASSITYTTLDELGNHRLAMHERPADMTACTARLAAESHLIGRARVGDWAPDLTHWHSARIAGRNGVAPEIP